MDCDIKKIGQRIIELRKKHGNISQEELAKKLNVTRDVVAKWELGKRDLKTEYTVKLADFFGVTCDFILRGIESENVDIHKITGLYDNAIKNLKDITEIDRQLCDGGNIDPLKEGDYLNAIFESDYFVEFYYELQQYCEFAFIRLFYEKFKSSILKPETTDFFIPVDNEEKYDLIIRGKLANCIDVTELLIKDVANKIKKKQHIKIDEVGGGVNAEKEI